MRLPKKYTLTLIHSCSAALFLFFIGITLFSSAGRDDVFKTLFPAWTLSEFGQILNYNGAAIEQSSSLLQVLLIGFLHKILGGNIVQLGSILAVLSGMATVILSPFIGKRLGLSPGKSQWLPWLIAGSSFVNYWSWGGLDASLAALFTLLFLDSLTRFLRGAKPWIYLGTGFAFVLVRPENGLIGLLGLTLLSLYTWRSPDTKFTLKQVLTALFLLTGISLSIIALRLWLFGSPLPLPVQAKASSLNFGRIYQGASYYFWQMWRHPEFLALLTGAAAASSYLIWKKKIGKHIETLSFALAMGTFILFSGGDWMENGRFFVPLIPLLSILLLAGIEPISRNWTRPTLWGMMLLCTWGMLHTARHHSTGKPLWAHIENVPQIAGYSFAETANRVHARDIEMCQHLITYCEKRQKDKSPIKILSQQAGMVIFHTAKAHFRKIQFIDLVGLSTPDFLECKRTQNRGATFGGLNMDLYYLMQDADRLRKECGFELPDIIFDLDNERHEKENYLVQFGYKTIYKKEGEMRTTGSTFPGMHLGAWQILMVRQSIEY